MSGLEALGIAASIIQVADLGTKLSVKLFSFYRRAKDANDTLQLLSSEVALVSAILRELGDKLEEKGSSDLCSEEAFRTIYLVQKQCRDVLGQINRVVDNHQQAGKSRFQQVTGKFRIVLLEPSLDPLRINLERLKSTMVLLLNVILYAGQIRSNNVPALVEEQRDFIQSLLDDRQTNSRKPQQPDMAEEEAPRGFSTSATSNDQAYNRVPGTWNQKTGPSNYQPSLERQSSQSSMEYASSSESQTRADIAPKDNNKHTELTEYNTLIQNMLDEIELRESKLEKNRHSRIKNGVLNIHSGEIVRFQIEHGSSIHFDHSLFAERVSENSPEQKATSPDQMRSVRSSKSNKASGDVFHINSDESDFSETDAFIRGRKGRTFSHCRSREEITFLAPVQPSSSTNRPASADRQRLFERSEPVVIVVNEDAQRTSSTNSKRPRRVQQRFEDKSEQQLPWSTRRRADVDVSRKASRIQRAFPHILTDDSHQTIGSRQGNYIEKQRQEIKALERELQSLRRRSPSPRPIDEEEEWSEDGIGDRLRRLERFEHANMSERKQKQAERGWRLKRCEEDDQERRRYSSSDASSSEYDEVAQRQMPFEDISTPDNMEDLLAQWTTLNRQEIHCGPWSAFE